MICISVRNARECLPFEAAGDAPKELGGLAQNVRDLVAEFFEDGVTDPVNRAVISFVKEHVFGKEASSALMSRHSISMLCTSLPLLERYAHLLCERTPPPDVTVLTRQVSEGAGRCSSPR